MIATSGYLIASECTKFVCGRGCAPDPAWGAHSAPPYPVYSWFKRDPTSEEGERGIPSLISAFFPRCWTLVWIILWTSHRSHRNTSEWIPSCDLSKLRTHYLQCRHNQRGTSVCIFRTQFPFDPSPRRNYISHSVRFRHHHHHHHLFAQINWTRRRTHDQHENKSRTWKAQKTGAYILPIKKTKKKQTHSI